ncbi:MAG: RluA family pseudouridine synthase [Candidatus Aminicenantes bacterium]|nr:RluA family pseudouridine synthase [Candidatus Aminicenantes bacterium]
MPKKEFLITPLSGLDQRLDVFLSKKINELTRSQIQKSIKERRATVNNEEKKANHRLKVGERVEIDYELPEPDRILSEDIPLDIIDKDDHIIVINKASGMVVHPGAGNREHTLVNALLHYFPEIRKIGPEERPGIVHRLDKETSGLMVVAKSAVAHRDLQEQFKKRGVVKRYLGLVWGRMPEKEGKIDWAIGRHAKHGERISIRTKRPRKALTQYSVRRDYGEFTLLEIQPVTGRTHQIRVHLAAAGHPIAGDLRYGRRKTGIKVPRLFLHASYLSFCHPVTEERAEYSSPLPADLKDFLSHLEK